MTRFFEGTDDIVDAIHRVNTEADVVWVDGHSDYGHAFEVFWRALGQGRRPEDDRADLWATPGTTTTRRRAG